jgi:hypothetical protein
MVVVLLLPQVLAFFQLGWRRIRRKGSYLFNMALCLPGDASSLCLKHLPLLAVLCSDTEFKQLQIWRATAEDLMGRFNDVTDVEQQLIETDEGQAALQKHHVQMKQHRCAAGAGRTA